MEDTAGRIFAPRHIVVLTGGPRAAKCQGRDLTARRIPVARFSQTTETLAGYDAIEKENAALRQDLAHARASEVAMGIQSMHLSASGTGAEMNSFILRRGFFFAQKEGCERLPNIDLSSAFRAVSSNCFARFFDAVRL